MKEVTMISNRSRPAVSRLSMLTFADNVRLIIWLTHLQVAQTQHSITALRTQYRIQQSTDTLAHDILISPAAPLSENAGRGGLPSTSVDVSDILELRAAMGLDANPHDKTLLPDSLNLELDSEGALTATDKGSRRRTRHLAELHQNLNRLTGLTGFRVRDPSAGARRRYMLGIRYDIPHSSPSSSPSAAGFAVPHYILIRQAPPSKSSPASLDGSSSGQVLEIFTHTIPAFIPLQKLAKRYLNTNLKLFARAVRTCLVLFAMRARTFRGLVSKTQQHPGGPVGVVRRVEANSAYTSVRLFFNTGTSSADSAAEEEQEEGSDEKEVLLECSEDTVVYARLVNAGQRRPDRDLPLVMALKGSIEGLKERLMQYRGQVQQQLDGIN